MDNRTIAIYGAQMVAVSIYYAIKALYTNVMVFCFIVKDDSGNPASIDGLPVVTLEEFHETNMKIIIATPENHHSFIIEDLKKHGINNYQCMDSRTEAALMERYYNKMGVFPSLRSYMAGRQKAGIAIYMSKFYRDQPLQGEYHFPGWICPIQAGASLTDICIASVCDNEGENISEKNVNYCELSSLYWIWKHECEACKDYIGLFHYRRVLDIQEEDLYRLKENRIDVVLPYPTVCYPDIRAHHKRYLKDGDWDAMRRALQECAPNYAARLPEIFSKQYFYNYNMFIAKRGVFKDYCNWLFPILQKVEELSVPKGKDRADRYIGYLGENLMTLYFMLHQKDYRIAHAGRRMLL